MAAKAAASDFAAAEKRQENKCAKAAAKQSAKDKKAAVAAVKAVATGRVVALPTSWTLALPEKLCYKLELADALPTGPSAVPFLSKADGVTQFTRRPLLPEMRSALSCAFATL